MVSSTGCQLRFHWRMMMTLFLAWHLYGSDHVAICRRLAIMAAAAVVARRSNAAASFRVTQVGLGSPP